MNNRNLLQSSLKSFLFFFYNSFNVPITSLADFFPFLSRYNSNSFFILAKQSAHSFAKVVPTCTADAQASKNSYTSIQVSIPPAPIIFTLSHKFL